MELRNGPSRPLKTLKDTVFSFVAGAVPAFLGTAMVAGVYSLAYGLAAAAGLGVGLAVTAGVLASVATLGMTIIVGGIAGTVGLAVLGALPFVKNTKMRPLAATMGIASGLAASVALAYHLTSESAPQPPARAPEATVQQKKSAPIAKKISGLGGDFGAASEGMILSPANAQIYKRDANPSPALHI